MMKLAIPFVLAASALPAFAQGAWSDPSGVPLPVWPGGSFVSTDADTIYVSPGNKGNLRTPPTSSPFYKFKIQSGTWQAMTPVPGYVTDGSTMAFRPGTSFIYLLCGERVFYRYDISQEGSATSPWTPLSYPTSVGRAIFGTRMVVSGSRILVLLWNGFYEYAPDTDTWLTAAKTPPPGYSSVGNGTTMICPGAGRYVYACIGQGQAAFAAYDTVTGGWTSLAPLPEAVNGGGALVDGPNDGAGNPTFHAVTGYSNQNFYRYAGGAWTLQAAKVPSYPGNGLAMVRPAGSAIILVLRGCSGGSGTVDLWRYDTGTGRFLSALKPVPDLADAGACLEGVGDGEHLYAFRGFNTTDFLLYTVSTGEWTALAAAPAEVGEGGSLAWDGGRYIYATRGQGTTAFWRYSMDALSWEDLTTTTPIPYKMGVSGRIIRAKRGLYAIRGQGPNPDRYDTYEASHEFYRYIPGSVWDTLAGPADSVFDIGSAIAWDGVATVHAITFDASSAAPQLRSYSIDDETWSAPSALPAGSTPGQGAAMCCPAPGRPLFVMMGGTTAKFHSYTPESGWQVLPDVPGTIGGISSYRNGGGGSLGYPGRGTALFALQGGFSNAFWRYDLPNARPDAPTSLGQLRADGVTVLVQGAVMSETSFIATARVSDPDDESVTFHVELQPAGTAFTGTSTAHAGPFAAGTASVTLSLQMDRAYHWQAWTVDARGLASPVVSMGSNPEVVTEIDLAVRSNRLPTLSGVVLRAGPAGASFGPQGRAPTTAITAEARIDDADGDEVALQVEIAAKDHAFTGSPTATGQDSAAGSTSSVTVADLATGTYRVRVRAVDALGDATAWSDVSADGVTLLPVGSAGPSSTCFFPPATSGGAAGGVAALVLATSMATRRLRVR